MSKLSAIVIVHNGEHDIADCLRSLAWVDEIIIVDDESTDRTVAIAAQYTNKIFHSCGKGFADNQNFAADQTTGDWILHLDADERVIPELEAEIKEVIASPEAADGYYIPRRTFWLGRWIKHGGWYPDYALRLFRKSKARCVGIIHEHVVVSGSEGRLENPMLHYSYPSVQAHVERMVLRYAVLETREAVAQNVRIYALFPVKPFMIFISRFLHGPKTGLAFRMLYKELIKNRIEIAWLIPFMPLFRFLYCYVFQFGFLDGIPGFWIASLSGCYEAVRYAKLWEHFYRQRLTDFVGVDRREVWDQSSLKV